MDQQPLIDSLRKQLEEERERNRNLTEALSKKEVVLTSYKNQLHHMRKRWLHALTGRPQAAEEALAVAQETNRRLQRRIQNSEGELIAERDMWKGEATFWRRQYKFQNESATSAQCEFGKVFGFLREVYPYPHDRTHRPSVYIRDHKAVAFCYPSAVGEQPAQLVRVVPEVKRLVDDYLELKKQQP